MSWLTLALIAVFSASISTITARAMMKKEDSNPVASAIAFQFILGIFCLIFTLILNRFTLPNGNVSTVRFLLSGALWAMSTLFSFKAIKLLGASETTILISGNVLIITILGVLFLKEPLTLKIIFGIIFILGAILIVNSEHLTFRSKRGTVYALLTAFISGVAVVNDVVILKTYEAFSFTTLMSFLPGIFLAFVFPKDLIKVKNFFKLKSFRPLSIMSFFYAIQALAFYYAYEIGASVVKMSTLTKANIVVTVIFAAIFLKERSNTGNKIAATLMITMGAILLS